MKMRSKRSKEFEYWYIILAFIRIFLVFIPQTGYIHPDEYFQSVEVLAGKVFEVENSPPWEFNTTFPIRSMAIPYFTIGMSYIFLRDINELAMRYLSTNLVTPYFLLVVPRLLMCICSFVVDYCLYKICTYNNEKYKSKLIVLGSSFVILVYGSRTFSNTLELFFFSILLYFVSESVTFSNILSRKREYINYRYEKSKTVVEKAKFHKLKLYLISDSYRNCFIICTITVLGFFNRPTFLAFAVTPIFFWIYRGFGNKTITVVQFHTRILFFALCSLPSFVLIILIDSFYYGYITWGEVGMLDISINNFVVTPLNFLKYNTNFQNLATHGLHPRFLHLLVNIPLLFNILGILSIFTLGTYIYLCFRKKFHQLPSIRSLKCLMTGSFVTPILILSIFPHQEPRFIIPILLPLVYLHGSVILPESDNVLVKVPESSIQSKKDDVSKIKKDSHSLLKLWILLNFLCVILFGFLHQGGVYQAVAYLERDIKLTSPKTEFHIVTSHIYSIPESFLLQKASTKLYATKKTKYSVSKRVFLYEEGSKDLSLIADKLRKTVNNSKSYRLYLLISSSHQDEIEELLINTKINFTQIEKFWPHISVEAFPDLRKYCLEGTSFFYSHCDILSFTDYFSTIFREFQLLLYDIRSS